jgi:hypothetical protein
VSSAIVVVLILMSRVTMVPAEWASSLATVGATATVLSVAFVVGGRFAVLVFAGIMVLERVLTLPGLMRFCLAVVSDSSVCSPFSYLLGLWPQVVGAALAYVLVRWLRAAGAGRNPLLEAAGALALTQSVAVSVFGALLPSASALESGLLLLVSAVAGGIGCGLVLLRRVPESRRWPSLGLIALAVVGVFLLASVPSFVGQVGIGGTVAVGGLNLIGLASPLVEVGIAAVILYMAAARKVAATQGA